MPPSTAVSATVRAIHGVRKLSRASHDLVAREILIRVERRIMTLIMTVDDDGPGFRETRIVGVPRQTARNDA